MNKDQLVEKANSLLDCLKHLSTKTGRRRNDTPTGERIEVRDPFIADEAKLLSAKSFRLLEHKTQVATTPLNPFIRNRKTHVLEVVACSVIVADALGLNSSLARAIAIGHDIGHVPFGHQGEDFMRKAMGKPKFCHEVMAPIIAQKIERRGKGLNLTFETLEGMMCHSGDKAHPAMTPEAWIVRHTDKFAYLFADYNDLVVRMKYPAKAELRELVGMFGRDQRERTSTAMCGLIVESAYCGKVSFDESESAKLFRRLRTMMYEIYPRVTVQDTKGIMEPVLQFLMNLNICDPFLLLALMTDKDVLYLSGQRMLDMTHLQQTAISEFLPYVDDICPSGRAIDLCDPDLGW